MIINLVRRGMKKQNVWGTERSPFHIFAKINVHLVCIIMLLLRFVPIKQTFVIHALDITVSSHLSILLKHTSTCDEHTSKVLNSSIMHIEEANLIPVQTKLNQNVDKNDENIRTSTPVLAQRDLRSVLKIHVIQVKCKF